MAQLPHFGTWDLVLIVAVSVQCTVVAYLHQPRLKALVFMLPIPFTCAFLAIGQPINSAHVAGLFLLFGFTLAVRGLHVGLRLPIIPSIALADIGYCLLAAGLRPYLPVGPYAFWSLVLAAAATALIGWRLLPHRSEPGHRSALPVWIKLPLIAALIALLICLKSYLQGLMALFPFVATVSAYEARHSLWTLCRQMPVLIALFLPLMIVLRFTQPYLGPGGALAIGWLVYLSLLLPYWRRTIASAAQPSYDLPTPSELRSNTFTLS